MDELNVVVVGGSAGGVEAALRLAGSLPADLNAAVFVCIHISPSAPTALPELMARRSQLRAGHAIDGDEIRPGRIYVAPPDRHLLIEDGRVRLGRGARENGHRPAVNPLFCSAAQAYGERVTGVILSGNLDDGTAGLREIRRQGGYAIVQDPDDALFRGMPANAIELAGADQIIPVARMGDAVAAHVGLRERTHHGTRIDDLRDDLEGSGIRMVQNERAAGDPSRFGCPSCGGVLWELKDGGLTHYRCRVGHAFSDESLLDAQSEGMEQALWAALRALEEAAEQAHGLAARTASRGHERLAERFRKRASDAEQRAAVVRRTLLRVEEGNEARQAG